MQKKLLLVVLTFACGSTLAMAANDMTELKKQGYQEWKTTTVKESFKGCKAGETVPFDNGLSFKCSEAEDHDTKKDGNKVTILKSKSGKSHKVFIGNECYKGQLMGVK